LKKLRRSALLNFDSGMKMSSVDDLGSQDWANLGNPIVAGGGSITINDIAPDR
jgi:hypothetical protein